MKNWTVKTMNGFAGGNGETSLAKVALDITTQAQTVEEVRAKVEALPDLLEAMHQAIAVLMEGKTCNGKSAIAVNILRVAIAKLTAQSIQLSCGVSVNITQPHNTPII